MSRHRVLRGPAVLMTAAVLLVPSGVAAAADDPVPVEWPKVEVEQSGAQTSDPKVEAWPKVIKPESTSGNDPKPLEWPGPEPG